MAKSDNSIIEKGKNLILSEKYDEALKYFKDIYDKNKENVIYPNYIGLVYLLKEEFKNAADYFKKAIDVEPDNWYSYHKLGQICHIKKIEKCAIDYFTETIERNPKDIYAFINLALIFEKEDQDLSIELINSALEVDPLNLIANYLLGTIFLKQKDFKNAEKLLLNVTKKNSDFLMGWYKLGTLYFKMGKSKNAIETLSKALSISKKPYIYNLLGLISLQRFKLDEAVDYLKESIKLDPEDPSTWINLADAYQRGDKIDSAKLCLKEALKLTKNKDQEFSIWANYANCYEKEDKMNYCVYCLEQARECVTTNDSSKLEDFKEEESKMEYIHRISIALQNYEKEGHISRRPDDIDE